MFKLYGILILMLLIALSVLAIPFIKNQKKNLSGFILITVLMTTFSLVIYQTTNHHRALQQWITSGQQHYQLQIEVNKLGGIDGIINSIKVKLATNPEDAKGWLILGKLYIDKQDYLSAKNALEKAQQLDPDNIDIKYYYKIATQIHDK